MSWGFRQAARCPLSVRIRINVIKRKRAKPFHI